MRQSRFFSPLKSIPVLPPTAASTAASRVVGMLMRRMPRLKVAAANPPISVTTPPPRFMTAAERVAPLVHRESHIEARVSSVLCSSPAGMTICSAEDTAELFFADNRQTQPGGIGVGNYEDTRGESFCSPGVYGLGYIVGEYELL